MIPWSSNKPQTHQGLRKRLASLPTFLSFLLAGAFLIFLVTRFDIDLDSIWTSFKSANLALVLLALLVHYTTFVFRGARWRLLLKNAQENTDTPDPGVFHCSSLVLLGWFTNSVTWFRLGDAHRAYAYVEDSGASFPRTMGTILAERVLDVALVMLLVLLASFLLIASGVVTPWITPWVFVAFPAFLTAGLAGLLVAMRLFRSHLAHYLPRLLHEAYNRFHEGTVTSFRRVPLVSLLGLLGWLAEVGRLFFVAEALGIPLEIPLVIFVTLASAMLTLVPLTPGGLGAVEWGATGLLLLSPAVGTETAAFSIVALDRSISWLSVIAVGAVVVLGREIVRWRRRTPAASKVSIQG